MFKKLRLFFYVLSFTLIIPFLFYLISPSLISYSQTIVLSDKKVIYELPYPGILPDHPLYMLKMVRDKMIDLATRDNVKKAELYFLYSDKRVAMAITLAKKGKAKLALTTLTKGEKYFYKIPPLLTKAKTQGTSPSESLIYKLKLSNTKHKQIMDEVAKQIPQGQETEIQYLFDLNEKIRIMLAKF